jgi:hypothetical protein
MNPMLRDFSTRFTAWLFIAAGVMLWGGWLALPTRIGTYFQPDDFAKVSEDFYVWIWTYRVHLFGMVMTAMAVVALASLLVSSPARVMVWPGAAVVVAGMIVGAVGAAFYYHHGAWGALTMAGKSSEELLAFVDALRIDTEYVTCLVRFGRVFSGLGLLAVGCGLIKEHILPVWVGGAAAVLGLVAMGLTMLLPDQMELYQPVFHAQSLWLVLTGVVILRHGIRLSGERGT